MSVHNNATVMHTDEHFSCKTKIPFFYDKPQTFHFATVTWNCMIPRRTHFQMYSIEQKETEILIYLQYFGFHFHLTSVPKCQWFCCLTARQKQETLKNYFWL